MDQSMQRLSLLAGILAQMPTTSIRTDRAEGKSGPVTFGCDHGGPWVVMDGGKRLSFDDGLEYIGHLLISLEGARQMEWALERGLRKRTE